jgi:hypothetical protein
MNRGRIGTLSLMKRQVCSLTGLQVPHPHDLKAPFDSNETERVVRKSASIRSKVASLHFGGRPTFNHF